MRIDRPEFYFRASLERINQSWSLYRGGTSYSLSMYVAGVAVECLLRAFKMRRDDSYDEKHDLRRLFKASGMLNVDTDALKSAGVSEAQSEDYFRKLQAALNDVYRLWGNDYRYASEDRLRVHLKSLGLARGVRGDALKANALKLLNSAQVFMDKGKLLWGSPKK